MKFGEYLIPARTKATVIGKPNYHEVNIPGLQLRLAINLFDAHPKRKTGVPSFEIEFNNELEELENERFGKSKSYMTGICIWTQGDQVYMNAGDPFYERNNLTEWQMKKIFGENIPENIWKAEFGNDYRLDSTIEYLEDEFAKWVQNNCDFHYLTEQDIESGEEGFDGAEPGDKILSNLGMNQFEEKQMEYINRLEKIGFTYEFKGGLIWE